MNGATGAKPGSLLAVAGPPVMVVVDSWLCEMRTEVGCGVGFIGRNGWVGRGKVQSQCLGSLCSLSLSVALDNSEVLSQRSALAFSHVPPWHSHLF